MKRLMILLLCMLLTQGAHAQEGAEHWTTTFQQCPDYIRAHLILGGYPDADILCGASDEHRGTDLFNSVLLLAQRNDERFLIGLQWVNGREERYVYAYRHLPWNLGEISSVDVVEEPQTADRVRFSLRFGDGSRREIAFNLGTGWRLHSYHAPDGTVISWRVGALLVNGESFPSTYSCWLNDLPAVRAFPATRAEAAVLAARSWDGLENSALGGGHLRQEPTTASRSLGRYAKVRMQVITERGGWYKVRIGDTEGWMNGTYVHFFSDREEAARHCAPATPTAIAAVGCELMSAPVGGQRVWSLSDGQEMRVLAQTAEGWLHVLVPLGELGWQLGADGVYGYVQRSTVDAMLPPLAE